jgi:hypothetical protein
MGKKCQISNSTFENSLLRLKMFPGQKEENLSARFKIKQEKQNLSYLAFFSLHIQVEFQRQTNISGVHLNFSSKLALRIDCERTKDYRSAV